MKEFIKKRYNILIPIFLFIVLLISAFLYGREYKNNRYANITENMVYSYFNNDKIEYNALIGRNKKNVILNFEAKDFNIDLDSTPIYISEDNNVIFPKNMSIVFPLKNKEYRLDSLSEIYKSNGLYYLRTKKYDDVIENAFVFDGKNLYLFIDNVNLIVGNEIIELSPLSYINCSYQNLIEYYDKEDDKYGVISLTNENVYVENNYMKVDVGTDKIIYKSDSLILTKDFNFLDSINN